MSGNGSTGAEKSYSRPSSRGREKLCVIQQTTDLPSKISVGSLSCAAPPSRVRHFRRRFGKLERRNFRAIRRTVKNRVSKRTISPRLRFATRPFFGAVIAHRFCKSAMTIPRKNCGKPRMQARCRDAGTGRFQSSSGQDHIVSFP